MQAVLLLLMPLILLLLLLPVLDHRDRGPIMVSLGSYRGPRGPIGGGVPRLGRLVTLGITVGQMPLAEHHPLVVVPLARGRRRPARHLAHPELKVE